MSLATASRTIKFVSKGGTYTAMLVGNAGDIYQIYDGTNVYPDFADTNPVLSLVCTSTQGRGVVSFNSVEWQFNGVTLSFGSNNKNTDSGMSQTFERLDASANNGYPGLKILKNLISPSNPAPAVIKFVGKFTNAGIEEEIHATYNISARQGNSDTYIATISSTDGRYALTSENATVTLVGNLQKGGVNVPDVVVSYKWYKYDLEGGVMKWVQIPSATSQSLEVTDAMVDTYADFKVSITCGGVSYEDVQGVVDAQDEYEIQMKASREDLTIYDDMADDDGITFSNLRLVRRGSGTPEQNVTFKWSIRGAAGEEMGNTMTVGNSNSFKVERSMCTQGGDLILTVIAEIGE